MKNREGPGRVYPVLALGVVCISTGAIFARLADAPSLVIAAYRVGIAGLILLPFSLVKGRREMASLLRIDWLLAMVSGCFLALHFYFWISSLEFTTVAASVVLVNTNPVWTALAAPLFGERVKPITVIGIVLSFAGAFMIGWGDMALEGNALRGDIMALLGALSLTGYLFAGRLLRRKLSLLVYVTICYGSAGALLWAMVLLTGSDFTGFSTSTWLLFPAMAIVPQIMGHSSYNWALKYLSAPMVAVTLLGEPIGSSILAWLILSEIPTGLTVAGGCLILGGIMVAARGEQKN